MHWIAWVNKFRCNSHVIAHKNTKHSTNRFKYEDYGQHYSTKVGLWYDQKTIHDEILSKKAIFEPKKSQFWYWKEQWHPSFKYSLAKPSMLKMLATLFSFVYF